MWLRKKRTDGLGNELNEIKKVITKEEEGVSNSGDRWRNQRRNVFEADDSLDLLLLLDALFALSASSPPPHHLHPSSYSLLNSSSFSFLRELWKCMKIKVYLIISYTSFVLIYLVQVRKKTFVFPILITCRLGTIVEFMIYIL